MPFTRTLRIGGVSKSSLLNQLHDCGVQINALGFDLFSNDQFRPATEQVTVKVVQASVAELCLSQGGRFDEIAASALKQSLSLCPIELGPHLRLASLDQKEGSIGLPLSRNCAPPGSVTVASAPISEDDAIPKGFYLRVIEGVPWLRGFRSWHGHVWAPADTFVFIESFSAA